MDTNTTLLLIAAILALPGGLFLSFVMSEPRARWLALLGGIVGDAAIAGGIVFYLSASQVSVDALSYGLGAFFACSMGVFCGALVMNFLVGLASRGPRIPSTAV